MNLLGCLRKTLTNVTKRVTTQLSLPDVEHVADVMVQVGALGALIRSSRTLCCEYTLCNKCMRRVISRTAANQDTLQFFWGMMNQQRRLRSIFWLMNSANIFNVAEIWLLGIKAKRICQVVETCFSGKIFFFFITYGVLYLVIMSSVLKSAWISPSPLPQERTATQSCRD